MRTVGVFSALVATWQAAASTSVQAALVALPESVGIGLWGVSLLALAAFVRQRSAKQAAQRLKH